MTRKIFGVLALLALLLIASLSAELRIQSPAPVERNAVAAMVDAPGRPASPMDNLQQRLVTTIIARPLFAPGRRSAQSASRAADGPGALPRLTGVVVSGVIKTATFAGDGNAWSTMAEEGGKIGEFVIRSIAAGEVTMAGPDGLHILHPSFDSASDHRLGGTASAMATAQPARMSILDLLRNGPPPSVGAPGLPPQPGAQKP